MTLNSNMEGLPLRQGSPGVSDGKESACDQRTQVQSLGEEDLLEKGMTSHSSILAWRIPWTEEPWQTTVHRVAKSQT